MLIPHTGAVFSALRVYALSRRSWFLSVFTFILAVLAFPLDYYVRPCLHASRLPGRRHVANADLGRLSPHVLHQRSNPRLHVGGNDIIVPQSPVSRHVFKF